MFAAATVNARGASRAKGGHPWIYRDDLVDCDAAPGQLTRVVDRAGRFCCWAAASPQSKIVLRRLSRLSAPPDERFWTDRLEAALARRGPAASDPNGAARLIHSEADGFPGLTCDRYGLHLVVQATTVWADRFVAWIAPHLLAASACDSLLARNDPQVRLLEGLERTTVQVAGTTPPTIEVEVGGAVRLVDPWRGHKTGLYLDQQQNHRLAVETFDSGRVADLFCGEGGFALPLALAGREVVAVDGARAGLERGEQAAIRAGVAERIEWIEADLFEWLSATEQSGEKFDAVILDPPPFARRRSEIGGAVRGYKELHRRGLRLLSPGGRLMSFSCSFNIDPEQFESVAREAAAEAALSVQIESRLGAASDHPELLELPESRYLKGLLLRVI